MFNFIECYTLFAENDNKLTCEKSVLNNSTDFDRIPSVFHFDKIYPMETCYKINKK